MRKLVTKILNLIRGHERTHSKSPRPIVVVVNPQFTKANPPGASSGTPKSIAAVFNGDTASQTIEINHAPRCKEEHGTCREPTCWKHGCQL